MSERENTARRGPTAALASSVLGILGLVLLATFGLDEPGEGATARPAESGGIPAPGVAAASELVEVVGAERTALQRPGEAAGPDPPGDLGASPAARGDDGRVRLRVRGRVIDTLGAPVPHVQLHIHPHGIVAEGPGDPLDLRISLVPVLDFEQARLVAEGFADHAVWIQQRDRGAREEPFLLGTVVLQPGQQVRGRVLTADGRPVAGGLAHAHVDDGDWSKHFVPCDEHGAFHFTGLPLTRVHLRAFHDSGRSELTTIDLSEGFGVAPVELRLPPGRETWSIRGRVVDAAGRAVQGVPIGAVDERSFRRSPTVRSDEGGAFELEVLKPERVHVLTAAHEVHPARLVRDVLPGGKALEIVLETEERIEFVVADERGAPIPWSWIQVAEELPGYGQLTTQTNVQAPEGVLALRRPRPPFRVDTVAPGFQNGSFEFERAVEGPRLVLTHVPGGAVRGTVVGPAGPVAGAELFLGRAKPPGQADLAHVGDWGARPFAILGSSGDDVADGETDAQGRFLLVVEESGHHAIGVRAPGLPATVFGPFELAQDRVTAGLRLELRAAGSVRGEVLLNADTRPGDILVGLSDGWSRARVARVEDDGSFRLDDLAPGSWQVRGLEPPAGRERRLHVASRAEEPPEWDVQVRAGQVARVVLDARDHEAFVLRGTYDVDGLAPTGGSVELNRLDGEGGEDWLGSVPVVDGTFELRLSRPARVRLSCPLGAEDRLVDDVQLVRGINDWSASVETVAVDWTLRGVPEQTYRLQLYRQGESPGVLHYLTIRAGAREGPRSRLPAGRYQIQPRSGVSGLDPGVVTVPAGGGRVELPLSLDATTRPTTKHGRNP